MRLGALALAALLLLVVQPTAGARGCTIDVNDPTNPQVYGDCVGSWGSFLTMEEGTIAVARTTDIGLAIEGGECEVIGCSMGVAWEGAVLVHTDGSRPTVHSDLTVDLRASKNGGQGSGSEPCRVVIDPMVNVPLGCFTDTQLGWT